MFFNLFISVASSVRIGFKVIRPDISMRLLPVLSFFGGSVSWGHSIVITMVSCRDTAGILIEKPANPWWYWCLVTIFDCIYAVFQDKKGFNCFRYFIYQNTESTLNYFVICFHLHTICTLITFWFIADYDCGADVQIIQKNKIYSIISAFLTPNKINFVPKK